MRKVEIFTTVKHDGDGRLDDTQRSGIAKAFMHAAQGVFGDDFRRVDIRVLRDEEVQPRYTVSSYGKHGYSRTVIDHSHESSGPKYVANFFATTEAESDRAERFASQLADQLNEEDIS